MAKWVTLIKCDVYANCVNVMKGYAVAKIVQPVQFNKHFGKNLESNRNLLKRILIYAQHHHRRFYVVWFNFLHTNHEIFLESNFPFYFCEDQKSLRVQSQVVQ